MTVQLLSDRCGCLFSYYQTGLDVTVQLLSDRCGMYDCSVTIR